MTEGPTAEDETGVLPPLLSPADYTNYTSGDLYWYLDKVGSVIRDVCRWQVYPNITVTNELHHVAPDLTVMLPSLYVTNVTDVQVIQYIGTTQNVYDLGPPSNNLYTWSPNGYVNILQPWLTTETPQTQVDFTPAPITKAYVSYSHGYSSLPDPITVVAMELVTRAIDERTLPSNYTSLSAGPFHANIAEPGMVLTEQQLRILGPYTLHSF